MKKPEMNAVDKNRERLKLALKASNEGIWKWDLENNEIGYSEKVLKIIGYSKEAAPHLFSDPSTMYEASDAHYLQDRLDEMFAPNGPEILSANCRFWHPEEKWIWLRIRGACVRDDGGRVLRIAGSMMDITPRKTTEIALEEERHLLDMLVESIPLNVYFKDEESKFIKANDATAKKMGLDEAGDIYLKSDHDFFDAVHADKSRKDEVMIMYTQEKLNGSLEKETWTGEQTTWCITSKYPWLNKDKKVIGTFGVSEDVTDLVNTQARLVDVSEAFKAKNRQYEEELSLANEVQQSILVRNIPPMRNEGELVIHFDTEYIPVDGLAGDFYEVIPISDTKTGILMSDVMGHGIRSALVVAMLRGLITREVEHVEDPAAFLTGLNQGLSKILYRAGVTIFATALYVVIDTEAQTLQLSNAGHPAPILKRGGEYNQFNPENTNKLAALGLIRDTRYSSHEIALSEISELLLYTDGIYETENETGDEIGIEGVIDLLNSTQHQGKHATQSLLEALRNYSYNNQFTDDVCMISIAIDGVEAH